MYMTCVKCSCSELKLDKTSAYFLCFDKKNEEIPFLVPFGYGSHLKAKLFFNIAFGLFSKVNHICLE